MCGENFNKVPKAEYLARITPTCVGKTYEIPVILMVSLGSPPRVWGKLLGEIIAIRENRITPTCVGKTVSDWRPTYFYLGSPPRVWGKLTFGIILITPVLGSPPRVWGKLAAGVAGSFIYQDHPHVCGENC